MIRSSLVIHVLLTLAMVDSLLPPPPKIVVVAGATGKTGRIVVSKLIETSPNVTVRAFVRDSAKAAEVLPTSSVQLEIFKGDLGSAADISRACEGADSAVWCATGFSDSATWVNKLRGLFGIAVMPSQSIDIIGVEAFARALSSSPAGASNPRGVEAAVAEAPAGSPPFPRVVMLSSAGVTRPAWDEAKKGRLDGAADIPIVRLNPFGILGKKCDAEQRLRDSGVPYCVVRPCGLNDDWPEGRPLFSQGDVAVGRTNRADVAGVLAACVSEPSASGKTFEMLSLKGYPAPRSLAPALARLLPDLPRPAAGAGGADSSGAEWKGPLPLEEGAIAAEYAVLQQLLPGEAQDATALEMGRTYEQVDKGEVQAREARAEATDREKKLASTVR